MSESETQSERLILYSEKDEAEVSGFIEDEFGPFSHVYHELLSTDMHIDIAMIPPHEGRNYYTLCTIGAGAYRMNVDSESRVKHQQPEHSEFMIYLPADWKLDDESLKDESNYWPIRLLKNTARLSRRTGSWLGKGHTIGSESGKPYSAEASIGVVTVRSSDDFDLMEVLKKADKAMYDNKARKKLGQQ